VLELPHRVTFNPDLTMDIVDFHESFDWGNLSRGQRQRVTLALNFAFQDVFEFMNFPISLLMIDELIDSGICNRGATNALKALKEMCNKKHKRVLLVTHREDISAQIDDVLTVVLEHKLSRINQEESQHAD
jgi:energy-coupling factor transporter ATP-binding protein EcfA2